MEKDDGIIKEVESPSSIKAGGARVYKKAKLTAPTIEGLRSPFLNKRIEKYNKAYNDLIKIAEEMNDNKDDEKSSISGINEYNRQAQKLSKLNVDILAFDDLFNSKIKLETSGVKAIRVPNILIRAFNNFSIVSSKTVESVEKENKITEVAKSVISKHENELTIDITNLEKVNTIPSESEEEKVNTIPSKKEEEKVISKSLVDKVNAILDRTKADYKLNDFKIDKDKSVYELNDFKVEYPKDVYKLNEFKVEIPVDAYELNNFKVETPADAYELNNFKVETPADAYELNNFKVETPADAYELNNFKVETPADAYELNNFKVKTPGDAYELNDFLANKEKAKYKLNNFIYNLTKRKQKASIDKMPVEPIDELKELIIVEPTMFSAIKSVFNHDYLVQGINRDKDNYPDFIKKGQKLCVMHDGAVVNTSKQPNLINLVMLANSWGRSCEFGKNEKKIFNKMLNGIEVSDKEFENIGLSKEKANRISLYFKNANECYEELIKDISKYKIANLEDELASSKTKEDIYSLSNFDPSKYNDNELPPFDPNKWLNAIINGDEEGIKDSVYSLANYKIENINKSDIKIINNCISEISTERQNKSENVDELVTEEKSAEYERLENMFGNNYIALRFLTEEIKDPNTGKPIYTVDEVVKGCEDAHTSPLCMAIAIFQNLDRKLKNDVLNRFTTKYTVLSGDIK